ncbi:MAG: ATP-binding protein [Sandaracinaceae bacterium]|nr:ATP-binding protein [Sandaracinaceae bacterium]
MTVADRLGWTVGSAALLLFGLAGLLLIKREETDLRAVTEHELRVLGRSLQVAFENAMRDRQLEDVSETLGELERLDPTVDIHVFDETGAPVAASRGAMETGSMRLLVAQALASTRGEVRFEPASDPVRVYFARSLVNEPIRARWCLVVSRPLHEMRRDLATTRWAITASVVCFAILVAALTLALARLHVTTPMRRMIAAMRRAREEDFSTRLESRRRDEVGDAEREFDALLAALRAARSRLELETESKRRLEHALERADKLAVIGQLSAGLAHEIGSPLQVIEGRVRSLSACADRPDEVRRIASIATDQVGRITRIVEQLLRYARRRPPEVREDDVTAAVRDVLDLLALEARRASVELVLEAPRPCMARFDRDRVQQIVLNLVRNALAAGGHKVTVRLAKEASLLRIEVIDDGRGMGEATAARAFEPFFTTREGDGGTGLGLAVVQSLARQLGGTARVHTEPDHGARFTIELPLEGA